MGSTSPYFSNALAPGFSLPLEGPAPNNTYTEMSPGPPDPLGPHGPGQAGALPNQGYQDITPVASFHIFFDVFCAQQLKFEVKSRSPICIRFEHGSTTSLLPGIEAVIWQPHLHALSTTSSSSFLISFSSS